MNNIRQLRIEKGITQEEIGQVLTVQLSAISKSELGRPQPSADILEKLQVRAIVAFGNCPFCMYRLRALFAVPGLRQLL